MKQVRRVIPAIALLLVVGLVTAPAAQARHRHLRAVPMSKIRAKLDGQVLTFQHNEAIVQGFRKDDTHWWPKIEFMRRCDKAGTCSTANMSSTRKTFQLTAKGWRDGSGRVHSINRTGTRDGCPWDCGWYPWNWPWGKLFSDLWHKVIAQCLNGAAHFGLEVGSTNLALKVLVRGFSFAQKLSGPEGFAVGALAGCFSGIGDQFIPDGG